MTPDQACAKMREKHAKCIVRERQVAAWWAHEVALILAEWYGLALDDETRMRAVDAAFLRTMAANRPEGIS
jgi:hypothetical protein